MTNSGGKIYKVIQDSKPAEFQPSTNLTQETQKHKMQNLAEMC